MRDVGLTGLVLRQRGDPRQRRGRAVAPQPVPGRQRRGPVVHDRPGPGEPTGLPGARRPRRRDAQRQPRGPSPPPPVDRHHRCGPHRPDRGVEDRLGAPAPVGRGDPGHQGGAQPARRSGRSDPGDHGDLGHVVRGDVLDVGGRDRRERLQRELCGLQPWPGPGRSAAGPDSRSGGRRTVPALGWARAGDDDHSRRPGPDPGRGAPLRRPHQYQRGSSRGRAAPDDRQSGERARHRRAAGRPGGVAPVDAGGSPGRPDPRGRRGALQPGQGPGQRGDQRFERQLRTAGRRRSRGPPAGPPGGRGGQPGQPGGPGTPRRGQRPARCSPSWISTD